MSVLIAFLALYAVLAVATVTANHLLRSHDHQAEEDAEQAHAIARK